MEKIVLFQDANGKTSVNVRLDDDTVWLTQQQMVELFGSSGTNIAEHLLHIYEDAELSREATCRDFRQVQNEGGRDISRLIPHYNLDAIISVGYRVNSKQCVKFRQWATRTLNEHLTMGFTLNQNLLAERGVIEAQKAVDLLARTLSKQEEVLALVSGYSKTWKTLLQYDEGDLPVPSGTPAIAVMEYVEAMSDIALLKQALFDKGEATSLFGQERGKAFDGILGNIDQTMFGEPLYRSAEEKAANLFYFLIKDHPFSDGNKRIASFMFLRYMQKQNIPTQISPDALTAMALLVAESDPGSKDLMVRLAMNSIVESRKFAPKDAASCDSENRAEKSLRLLRNR